MHYKNGREAKAGDLVINLETGEAGLLYALVASSTTCNGRISHTSGNDSYITVGQCVLAADAQRCLELEEKLQTELAAAVQRFKQAEEALAKCEMKPQKSD